MEPPITPAATTAAVGGEESPNRISAAADHEQQQTAEDDDDSSSDFEFSFVSDSVPDITADELFSNGRILPVYPLFDRDLLSTSTPATDKPIRLPLRRLLIEEREAWSRSESTSSTSSSMDDLDGVPPETYCVWEPRSSPSSPTGWKKSSSTGSGSRRWRLRDLVRRSHSDGKEKFAFLSEAAPPAPEKTGNPSGAKVKEKAGNPSGAKVKGKGGKVTEMDIVTAHRLYYSKSGERRLPQQRDLVGGFFANMNGLSLSRAHHPF